MKILLIICACLSGVQTLSQETKVKLNLYISPSICKSPTQNRVLNDGKATLTNLTRASGLFFGGGLELLRNLKKNWLIGGDLGFISKGYFAIRDVRNSNGSFSGTGFTRTDLNFVETSFFLGKLLQLKGTGYKISFSSGLFYGFRAPLLSDFGLKASGNDLGTLLSIGIERKRFFLKVNSKRGMINIENNVNSTFRTNIICFKFGYTIL
jgi:hypothetical protein